MKEENLAAKLTIKKGRQALQTLKLYFSDDVLTIGRHLSCDIRLSDDPKISRIHAAIVRCDLNGEKKTPELYDQKQSLFFIRDLGSSLGTKVDKKYVNKSILKDGVIISISEYDIIFDSSDTTKKKVSPVHELFDKVLQKDYCEMGTEIAPFFKSRMYLDFSPDQEEFLSNLIKEWIPIDYSSQPKMFLKSMLGLMKGQKGLIGCLSDGQCIVDETVGFEREDPPCDPKFIENLFKTGAKKQEGALWVPLPKDVFLAIMRTYDPAFNDEDLEFIKYIAGKIVGTLSHTSPPVGFIKWAAKMIGIPEIKKKAVDFAQLKHPKHLKSEDILILGETGTGKQILAQYIHDNSDRKDKKFHTINSSLLNEQNAQTELFGHKKGAYTGADQKRDGAFRAAGSGTLFLDEIGDIPKGIQPKLLTALQDRCIQPLGSDISEKVDMRVIAATDKDIEIAIKNQEFSRPLYERFPYKISIPPLCERKEEIALFVHYFLDKHSDQNIVISREALDSMRQYKWEGNIRELEGVINNLIMSGQKIIFSWDLPTEIQEVKRMTQNHVKKIETIKEIEKEKILEVLQQTRGNKIEAAEILGISRATLYNKLKAYSIKKDIGQINE